MEPTYNSASSYDVAPDLEIENQPPIVINSRIGMLRINRFRTEVDLPVTTNGRRCCYKIDGDIFCIKTDLFLNTLNLKSKQLIPPNPSSNFTSEFYCPHTDMGKLMNYLRRLSLEQWSGTEFNKASAWTTCDNLLFIGYEKGRISVIDINTKEIVASFEAGQHYTPTHLRVVGNVLLAGFCRSLTYPIEDRCRLLLLDFSTGKVLCTLIQDAPGEIEYINIHDGQAICQVRLKAHETGPDWIRFRYRRKVYLVDINT